MNGGWIGVSRVWIGVLLTPINKKDFYLHLLLKGLSCACLGCWKGVLHVLIRVLLIEFPCLLITSLCCLRVHPVRVQKVGQACQVV